MGLLSVNMVCTLIILYSCFNFAKLCSTPSFFYILALPYFLYVVCIGYTRQSVAISLFMLAFYFKVNFNIRNALIVGVLGAGFHKTGIPFTILLLWKRAPKLIFILLTVLCLFFIYIFLENYFQYLYSNYVVGDFVSEGALFRVVISCLCATAYYFSLRSHIPLKVANIINTFAYLPYIFLFCLILWPELSTSIDRISLYLLPFNILVLSYVPMMFPRKYFFGLKMAFYLFSLLIFHAWLFYSSFRNSWFPYKSYLFSL